MKTGIAWNLVLGFIPTAVAAVTLAADGPAKESRMKNESWKNRTWTKEELRTRLTDLQYEVTQEEGTEPPFKNAYWDNKREGIYVDIVSGEPLFSSLDKYDSGTGWPSFTQPLEPANIATKTDRKYFFMVRTEVRSKHADSHLGHVFDDGPAPTGKRYCMNSASMRFIPVEDLEKEGYGQYLALFSKTASKSAREKGKTGLETAVFGAGCFWGVEDILRKIPGVVETQVGYTGGELANPTYEDVKTGRTGHAEAVRVTFDPSKVSYETILDYFFRLHDPTTLNRQGNDIGTQYRSVIFFENEEQKRIAERKLAQVEKSGKWKRPLVTQVVPSSRFYDAEDYHQDYLVKNPNGYTCHWLRD